MTVEFPNWFAMGADRYFQRNLTQLAGTPGLRFLQIGVFTGDATLWLLDNILTGNGSTLDDVDTWQGSDEPAHHALDFAQVERLYDQRTATARTAGRLVKHKTTSNDFFRTQPGRYDFIYIDGDHTARAVLTDAVHAYPLLKPSGLLAFDDYEWQSGKGEHHNPRLAIDAFASIYRDQLETVDIGAQAWFRRAA